MNQEKDEALCKKYPLIFSGRNQPMTETAMCWGFECGDGWYHILDNLCANIQNHIDWRTKQRNDASKYNIMVGDAKNNNWAAFDEYYKHINIQSRDEYKERVLNAEFQSIPDAIPQVVAVQVKEKFGGLRFYYNGGDDYIRGLASMAESMSTSTCEECGAPGSTRSGGWVRTLCDVHEAAYQKKQEDYAKDNGFEL
jgi:hypothetical protein